MPKHTKMKSKMGAKNGNKAARRGKMMGSKARKPMMGGGKKTKGYSRGGVAGAMPKAGPN